MRQGPQDRGRNRTVLIADGDRTLAEAVAATLDLSGLETVVTCDGDQALALARAMQIDLVLLGSGLPGKCCVEVCETLKADPVTATIPVIFVVSEGDGADRVVGAAAGPDEYLSKPFSPTELIGLVRETLAGHPIEPPPPRPDPSAMSADQLVIYARELRELFEREQHACWELEQARQRLDELDRLKAAFLSAVTHELLTPFASIGLALQVLQRQVDTFQPDQRRVLENLMTEIAGLHRLVTGVVKFAELVHKRREPQPGVISLDRVIPWAVQPAALLAQARGVDFRVFVPSNLPKVHADAELLGEAVFQMAHNALKFNTPGGQAQVRAFKSGQWVVIEVSDNGVGLTPERMELLGQPFEQSADVLRRGREGLGVGWAFVRYVAEAHGGWTRVASAGPGQGSTFCMAMPIATSVQIEGSLAATGAGDSDSKLSTEKIVVE